MVEPTLAKMMKHPGRCSRDRTDRGNGRGGRKKTVRRRPWMELGTEGVLVQWEIGGTIEREARVRTNGGGKFRKVE